MFEKLKNSFIHNQKKLRKTQMRLTALFNYFKNIKGSLSKDFVQRICALLCDVDPEFCKKNC